MEAAPPRVPSPKGESFVDRPTSNSPSEGADNAREKLRRKETPRISSITQFSARCGQSTVPKNKRQYINRVPDSSRLPSIKKKSKFSKECRVDLSAKIPLDDIGRRECFPLLNWNSRRVASHFCCDLCFLPPLVISPYLLISYLVLSLYLALFLSFFTLPTCHQIITVSRPPPAASRVLDLDSRTRTAITRVSARDLYPSIENRPRSCKFAHREDDSPRAGDYRKTVTKEGPSRAGAEKTRRAGNR